MAEMVDIPSVTSVKIGTDDDDLFGGAPEHYVSLSGCDIASTEVTKDQFAWFLNAVEDEDECNGNPCYDKNNSDNNINKIGISSVLYYAASGAEDKPAIGVTWDGALAYCGWAGRRLCTSAEWEYAATGPTYSRYPWGETGAPSCSSSDALAQICSAFPKDVASYPDNLFGLYDMIGGATEWVNDHYYGDYYQKGPNATMDGEWEGAPTGSDQPYKGQYSSSPWSSPTGPTNGEVRTLRGGGLFVLFGFAYGVYYRGFGPENNVLDASTPGATFIIQSNGIRCCD
jgi:formylglycine-generating enzyme required for sulfatase activity